MPDKETKKNQGQIAPMHPDTIAYEQEMAEKGYEKVKVGDAYTYRPKKIEVIETPQNMVAQAVVQGPSDVEQAATKAYDDNIKNTELFIKGLEGRKAQAMQQDETAQRKSRNMQMIAGISDGLASLANLIGVADRGSNINMGTGALTPLQQKFEAARLERQADIKSIDDRLEQSRRQLDQMRMHKGLAVAQVKEKERDRAQSILDRLDQQRFQEKLAKMQIDANERLTKQKTEATAAAKAADNAAKYRIELLKQTRADNRAKQTGANASAPMILQGEDGKYYSYDLTKAERAAIEEQFATAIKKDLKDPSNIELQQVYAEYEKALYNQSIGLGSSNKYELDDLRDELIALSPTMRGLVIQGRKGNEINVSTEVAVQPKKDSGTKSDNDEELDEVDALLESHKS